ncbi:U11/U12 small nuclear ribonucleoprotein 25 kDa protein isoform X4 [Ananas comosus]|uniref:U11/U12 small nuclear ribonucleoprotein 25 kDa protein isoform X4 n=1 Tax=Ananas comosus TaxID=4615 RepID=A0A6P5FME0_ANACO|nr:U11/U12 small nuclear ribonucleoprotein 25 kDa protein isoform X4 [Ananas comosus]
MDSGSKSEEIASYNNSSAKKSRLQSMLSALLDDPILSDVPKKPSLADVDTLLNLELGSAMKITIVKMDSTSFDVAVLNSATVKDLKLAIGKKINEIEQARMGHRHISWSTFCRSSRRGYIRNTRGGGNTASFMVLANVHERGLCYFVLSDL